MILKYPTHYRQHLPLLILLLSYLLLTSWMIIRLPAFAAPNEALHFEYIALLRQDKWLPDPTTSTRADERHQPPVYYVTATLFTLPFPAPPLDTELPINPYFTATSSGNLNPFLGQTPSTLPTLYAARAASLLFGLLALIALYVAANMVAPRPLSLLMVALVAFQPMFLFLSAAVNNDLAVTSMAALVLAYTSYLIVYDKPAKAYILWGVLFALAMLTKANAIFLAVLLPITCAWYWYKQGDFRAALARGMAGFLPFITIWGSWLLYNHFRTQDALGLAPSLSIRALFTLSPAEAWGIVPYLGELWRSFWLDWSPGLWGYGPTWLYVLAFVLFVVGLLGWLRPRPCPDPIPILTLLHLSWTVLLVAIFIWVKALMVRDAGYVVAEGRWVLPALPSMAWLVGWGWVRWWPPAKTKLASWGVMLPYGLLALFFMVWFLPALYPQAVRLADVAQMPPTAVFVNLHYDDQIELLATETDPQNFTVGQDTPLTLYWQAQQQPAADYSIAAQLLVYEADEWLTIGTTNSHPGLGLNPTTSWQAGAIYQDRLSLRPVASASSITQPRQAWLGVWLLGEEGLLPVTHLGKPTEWPFVQSVVVRPAVTPTFADIPRLDTAVGVADWFQLIGLQNRTTETELIIDLLWEATQTPPNDYTIFIHLYDAEGAVIAQSDSEPDNGRSPTTYWQTGDLILDRHQLPLLPPAGSQLAIGVYETSTGERLPLWQGELALQDGLFFPDMPEGRE